MIYSQTGGFQGLSFAIPINEAIKVKDEIVKTGHVSRGRLGVAVQGMNQTLANSFGMQKPQGALVSSVDPGGPAAKAGLQPGDVILSVNGDAGRAIRRRCLHRSRGSRRAARPRCRCGVTRARRI